MTTTSSGNLEIALPHIKAKLEAIEALTFSQDVTDHEVSYVSKFLPEIKITTIFSHTEYNDIKECVIHKTALVADLINAGEKLEVLFSEPSSNEFKEVVVRITPLMQDAIMQQSSLKPEEVEMAPIAHLVLV